MTQKDRPTPTNRSTRFLEAADRTLSEAFVQTMDLETYVETLFDRPSLAAHASKYLLNALESAGTRTVIERGERLERYCFFDDPYNDGEHAIQGHTAVLNEFVDDIRSIAAGRGKEEAILWIAGPTATGKSELKRCLINGLRAFSQTAEGRRFTLEWNVATLGEGGGLSYGDYPAAGSPREEDWYESPVQVHPLLVFPPTVRAELVEAIDDADGGHLRTRLSGQLDPFSREARSTLESYYRHRGTDELFSTMTGEQHLRVSNYIVDIGQGIGLLQSEDDGTPQQRLVGSWMQGALQQMESRGRRNPQAFSFDGVLAQGNGVMTIVEDAAQHADLLQRLLTVPDEGRVKLDTGIEFTVDTQLLVISNPDLEARLDQHADAGGADPLKALKRRLSRHEFRYLTTLSLETELLRRELTDERKLWDVDSFAELDDRVRASLTVDVRDSTDSVTERELAPHTLAAASAYAVLTRLGENDLPAGWELLDKVRFYDRGYHLDKDDNRVERSAIDIEGTADGRAGIPVTYTRDIIADLLQSDSERSHPDLAVENVILPAEVLDRMADELAETPLFSPSERREFEDRVVSAKRFARQRQERDVLEAMLAEYRIDDETLEEYVEHVYAWGTDEDPTDEHGEPVRPDPLRMKVIEIEGIGRFSEGDYDGTDPSESVVDFRLDRVITAVNRYAWEQRDDEFAAEDLPVSEIPALLEAIEGGSWADVKRIHEDFDPQHWGDPPEGTVTARLKEQTLDRMVADLGYSPPSAELTSRVVIDDCIQQWWNDE